MCGGRVLPRTYPARAHPGPDSFPWQGRSPRYGVAPCRTAGLSHLANAVEAYICVGAVCSVLKECAGWAAALGEAELGGDACAVCVALRLFEDEDLVDVRA